ncbi:MAG: hypothetical protein AAF368_01605, partial [Planctomycetota bacterium]
MRILVLCALWFAPMASADVLLVGGNNPDYVEIGDALAAAAEDDVLLIHPSSYQSFEIVGRSATLIASFGQFDVSGLVRVRDLAADQRVLISGMDVHALNTLNPEDEDVGVGLTVRDCLGPVRIHNSDCTGSAQTGHGFLFGLYDGIKVEDSSNVAITNSTARGGQNDRALFITDSKVATFDCHFDSPHPSGCASGGHGVSQLGDVHLFDSGSHFEGGDGASFSCSVSTGTHGGFGILGNNTPPQDVVTLSTNLHETTLIGGTAGTNWCEDYYGNEFTCTGFSGYLYGGFVPNFITGAQRDASFPVRVKE